MFMACLSSLWDTHQVEKDVSLRSSGCQWPDGHWLDGAGWGNFPCVGRSFPREGPLTSIARTPSDRAADPRQDLVLHVLHVLDAARIAARAIGLARCHRVARERHDGA